MNKLGDTSNIFSIIFFSPFEARVDSFGLGDGRFWFDELECFGNETDLINCPSYGLGKHDCWEYETAGVICGMETHSSR